MLYQLSYVGTTRRSVSKLRKMSSVDVGTTASTFGGTMNSTQDFCDALVSGCDDCGAQRIAAALVLLASVDDDLCLDLADVPAALRAIFDEA